MSTASSDVTHDLPKSSRVRYGRGMQQGKSGSASKKNEGTKWNANAEGRSRALVG